MSLHESNLSCCDSRSANVRKNEKNCKFGSCCKSALTMLTDVQIQVAGRASTWL